MFSLGILGEFVFTNVLLKLQWSLGLVWNEKNIPNRYIKHTGLKLTEIKLSDHQLNLVLQSSLVLLGNDTDARTAGPQNKFHKSYYDNNLRPLPFCVKPMIQWNYPHNVSII
jgi:hypothetical protein